MHRQGTRCPPQRMPRRFRGLALLLLLGLCLFFAGYYSLDRTLLGKVRHPAHLWTTLWTERGSEACRTPIPQSVRLNAADMYPGLDFGVLDNGGLGFWDDFLEMRYRRTRQNWKDLPLQVIVVPHSHVDPGWLMTFEDYQTSFVNPILDNLVAFLAKTPDFKFIWAEVSFFSEWWKRQNGSTKATVKSILQRQQLEFVTGGWVMPDEAVTSFFSNIDQLIEGHTWLRHNLDVRPQHGWSVDVFGHSASYPYVLSSAGISEIVIMRVHYAWKKFMARDQIFDFYWDQPFPSDKVLCHMAPSDLYSFKYACGPDPAVCLKYDFRRVDREYSESTAVEITDANVELKAGLLLSQYGRYASLFPHNVLLVPLGDDFRYNLAIEWEQQLKNYQKLFEFINNKSDWNANIRFGTPTDYFDEVKVRMNGQPFRSFEGDFMPYADIYANARPSYWSGFYTTRPFYKKLSRELEHWLRTSEILYSLAKTLFPKNKRDMLLNDYSLLVSARQKLALFQHHDAITGTSKEIVMQNYGRKLHFGILDAMSVVSHVVQLLMLEQSSDKITWTSQVYPNEYRPVFNLPTLKLPLPVPKVGRRIILFNLLTIKRTEVVRLRTKSALIKVVDSSMNDVPFQINPVYKDDFAVSHVEFELLFVATLQSLSFASYTIVRIRESEKDSFSKTVVSLYLKNEDSNSHLSSAFTFEKPKNRNFNFGSSKMKALFTDDGSLKSIFLKQIGYSKPLRIEFLTYRPWIYRSGAYLFCPESDHVTPIRNLTDDFVLMSVVQGSVASELSVMYHDVLTFSIRAYHVDDAPLGLELEVTSDVSKIPEDAELIMRIRSDVVNEDTFYTDSNGFQMLKRKVARELPVQGNYYPATSSVFIQDSDVRLNAILPHSHGVTARSGEIEVLLDRKIRYDDGRGVGEGVEDSLKVRSTFWLLLEPRPMQKDRTELSSDAFWLAHRLHYPLTALVSETIRTKSELSFSDEQWPADVHLINLRTLPNKKKMNLPSAESLMIVHQRRSASCKLSNGTLPERLASFTQVKVESINRTSLTGNAEFSSQYINSTSLASPLQAYKILFGSKGSVFDSKDFAL